MMEEVKPPPSAFEVREMIKVQDLQEKDEDVTINASSEFDTNMLQIYLGKWSTLKPDQYSFGMVTLDGMNGTYANGGGKLTLISVNEHEITFKWKNGELDGDVKWELSDDGNKLSGFWKYADKKELNSWNLRKQQEGCWYQMEHVFWILNEIRLYGWLRLTVLCMMIFFGFDWFTDMLAFLNFAMDITIYHEDLKYMEREYSDVKVFINDVVLNYLALPDKTNYCDIEAIDMIISDKADSQYSMMKTAVIISGISLLFATCVIFYYIFNAYFTAQNTQRLEKEWREAHEDPKMVKMMKEDYQKHKEEHETINLEYRLSKIKDRMSSARDKIFVHFFEDMPQMLILTFMAVWNSNSRGMICVRQMRLWTESPGDWTTTSDQFKAPFNSNRSIMQIFSIHGEIGLAIFATLCMWSFQFVTSIYTTRHIDMKERRWCYRAVFVTSYFTSIFPSLTYIYFWVFHEFDQVGSTEHQIFKVLWSLSIFFIVFPFSMYYIFLWNGYLKIKTIHTLRGVEDEIKEEAV